MIGAFRRRGRAMIEVVDKGFIPAIPGLQFGPGQVGHAKVESRKISLLDLVASASVACG